MSPLQATLNRRCSTSSSPCFTDCFSARNADTSIHGNPNGLSATNLSSHSLAHHHMVLHHTGAQSDANTQLDNTGHCHPSHRRGHHRSRNQTNCPNSNARLLGSRIQNRRKTPSCRTRSRKTRRTRFQSSPDPHRSGTTGHCPDPHRPRRELLTVTHARKGSWTRMAEERIPVAGREASRSWFRNEGEVRDAVRHLPKLRRHRRT